MSRNPIRTQAEHNAIMARTFPELYRPATAAEIALAAKPIAGMLFSIDQEVSHYLTRQRGTVESCSMYDDGRLKYVVRWSDGARGWFWETDLRGETGEMARPESVRESEAKRSEQARESGTSDLSPEENGARPALVPDAALAPKRPSMASQYLANQSRRGADGKYNPRKFVAQVQKIGDTIRQARSESDATGSGE